MRATSIITGQLLAAVLIPVALLATSTHAAAAVHAKPRVNSRGVSIVAGIHDTAINDCDRGRIPHPRAVTAGVDSRYWPSGVRNVRVTVPWDIADPGAIDMPTN